jgi:tetratricopeptide (TPR) repeat protein
VPFEWFRNPTWDSRVADEFERKLARARADSRPQYLRIKARALLDSGGRKERKVARELLERLLREYPDSLDVALGREALGEICFSGGQLEEAEKHYRAALASSLEGFVSGDAQLRLPEILIEIGTPEKLADAEAVLALVNVERDLTFKSQRFRFAVACARLAERRDNAVEAAQYASAALREASEERPDFSGHPGVGHVDADEPLLQELRRLAKMSGE